jgi:hypothetical protein
MWIIEKDFLDEDIVANLTIGTGDKNNEGKLFYINFINPSKKFPFSLFSMQGLCQAFNLGYKIQKNIERNFFCT